jgi:Mn-containing catalase
MSQGMVKQISHIEMIASIVAHQCHGAGFAQVCAVVAITTMEGPYAMASDLVSVMGERCTSGGIKLGPTMALRQLRMPLMYL